MLTRPARLLLPAGAALVLLVAVVAGALRTIDAEEVCRELGRCRGPADEAVLRLLGWVQGAGVLAVVAGLGQRVRARPAGPGRRRAGPALAAAGAGAGSALLVAVPVLVAAAAGPHVLTAAAVLVLLLHARLVTVLLDGRGPRVRAAALAGPVAAVAAAAVTVAAVRPGPGGTALVDGLVPPALLHGAVLGAVALLATGPVRAAVVAVAAAAVTTALVVAPAPVRAPVVAAPPPTTAPLPTAPPGPTSAPVAAPTPVPTPAPVLADAGCAPDDLRLTPGGWDAAMGLRAASVVARNTGSGACWLEGVPEIALAQGARPLRLAVRAGEVGGSPAPAGERIGLAPDGTASVLLTWRTHAGWADATTPQTLTVTPVAGGPPVDLPLGGAPMDVVDGAEVGVTGWRPAP